MSLKALETRVITLSVGLVLTLSQSNWKITRKKDKLEVEAREFYTNLAVEGKEIDDDEQLMATVFYPVMAACVISDNCPTIEECTNSIPHEDLDMWYQTARDLNPGWFVALDKIAELAEQEEREKADTALKKGMTNSEPKPAEKTLVELSTNS